jgi:hypothetical protein
MFGRYYVTGWGVDFVVVDGRVVTGRSFAALRFCPEWNEGMTREEM